MLHISFHYGTYLVIDAAMALISFCWYYLTTDDAVAAERKLYHMGVMYQATDVVLSITVNIWHDSPAVGSSQACHLKDRRFISGLVDS